MAEREGGETATYIYKKKNTHTQKKRYSKTIKGKSLDDGEERGLPSHYKKKKRTTSKLLPGPGTCAFTCINQSLQTYGSSC